MAPPKTPMGVAAIVYVLGAASMLPWNLLITADSFWNYKFRNVTVPAAIDAPITDLQLSFMPTLVIIANTVAFFFMFMSSWAVPRFSERSRVLTSLGGVLAVTITFTVTAAINTDQSQVLYYVAVMVMVAIINALIAVFQGSLFALVAAMDATATTAALSGMAVAGVAVSAAQILSLTMGMAEPVTSGLIYFSLAVLFVVVALVLYGVMCRMPSHRRIRAASSSDSLCVSGKPSQGSAAAYWLIFKKVWPSSLAAGLNLMLTLCVFPTPQVYVTSTTQPGPWRDVFFQPTATFLLFNVGDFLGRELCRLVRWPAQQGWTMINTTCLRAVLVVAILLCHGDNKTLVTVFDHDAYYYIINSLFGLSNGYVNCLTFIHYPTVLTSEEAGVGGTILGTATLLGVLLGSFLSPAMVAIWGPK